MTTTSLGTNGPRVFPVGLGCMAMSGPYGATNDDTSIALVRDAIDRGITLIDTADHYASGHNELLVGRAIAGRRDKVQVSVKFGMLMSPGGAPGGIDCRPVALKNFAAYSLRRLGVEVIDVYRPGRLDPQVPIEDTIGAIAELVQAGYVRHIGLSEVGVDTIRRAAKVHPIADLQVEYSLVSRKPEDAIFPVLAELGTSATLYGVMARGLLTGSTLKPGDLRARMPRFAAENQAGNERVVARIASFAADHRRTPGDLLIAWALARQPAFVPIIGARTAAQLDAIFAAVARPLGAAEADELEALVPRDSIVGDRYPAASMKHLDSER